MEFGHHPPSYSEEADWLTIFESYMADNFGNPNLTVAKMAQDLALSESTLLRRVKRTTGLSPNQYLQELRLTEAFERLQRSSMTVTEVANSVGYQDASAFSRAFLRRFGKRPSEL